MILAGGPSQEHDVSLVSARSVLAALQGHRRIEAQAQVIGRQLQCLSPEQSLVALNSGHSAAPAQPCPVMGSVWWQPACDVVLPLMHGPFGEDGTVQGFLQACGLPYIGSGVLASAICMDKIIAKQVLAAHQVPQVAFVAVSAAQWAKDSAAVRRQVAALPAPWFVKPSQLGSSVGIAKVRGLAGLDAALNAALALGPRALVEAAVPKPREIEVAMLGNSDVQATAAGEITYQADFYDYATKYTDGQARLHVPAQIDDELAARLQHWAKVAYAALDCAGLARVDFLVDPVSQQCFLNELNTMPGFTPFSMYPRLWQHAGLGFADLIERLCDLALQRHAPALAPRA